MSNVIILYFYTHIQDCLTANAPSRMPSPIDASQDWNLINGNQSDRFTTLEFS